MGHPKKRLTCVRRGPTLVGPYTGKTEIPHPSQTALRMGHPKKRLTCVRRGPTLVGPYTGKTEIPHPSQTALRMGHPKKRLTCVRRGPTLVGPHTGKTEIPHPSQTALRMGHPAKAKAHRLKPVPRKPDTKADSSSDANRILARNDNPCAICDGSRRDPSARKTESRSLTPVRQNRATGFRMTNKCYVPSDQEARYCSCSGVSLST